MDGPIVQTASGAVQGRWRGRSAAFLGIPFAAAPVGPLRYQAPAPVTPWGEVREATRFGPTPQRRPLAPVTTIPEPSVPGEDILNVSVFTPAPGEPERRLPVLVWIHGGGFLAGSPASPWYDGASFNRDGVVTASISYRLGFDGFGWLEDAPVNRGVLDMIAALEWVRENIAAFGGDPAAVTIGGQSAGGSAVLALLSCPRAQHLFRAAICQSAPGRTVWPAAAQRIGNDLATTAGVAPTQAGWSGVSEDTVLDLQSRYGLRPPIDPADPVELVRGVLFGQDYGLAFAPVVDGDLLPFPVEEALTQGISAAKPPLIGATAHAFNLALAGARAELADVDVVAVLAAAGLPADAAAEYVRAHPELTEPAFQLSQIITDHLFRLALLRVVDARSQNAGSLTWIYDFRWRSPLRGLSTHCIDLPFIWDLLDAEGVARSLGESYHIGASNTVYTGPENPSYVQLPIVPAK
jgi:para-nitrobenzyl esterase